MDIIETPATNLRGPNFELHDTKQRITACDIATLSPFVDAKPPLYIPTHAACIQIAYQFASQDDKHGYGPSSLSHIWRVLKARFLVSSKNRMIPPTNLYESHSYYGDLWRFQDMEWERGGDEESIYEAQVSQFSCTNLLSLDIPILNSNLDCRNSISKPTQSSSQA